MAAIDYVVRNQAGALSRGVVADGAQVSAVAVSGGDEISFNLRQADVSSYQRSEGNLVIELVDGRLVVIENYFDGGAVPNRLFLSADGYLNEVALVEDANGGLFAQYGVSEQWGKWSPSDDLIYLGRSELSPGSLAAGDEDVTQLAAGLLGGSGLLGAGAAGASAVGVLTAGGGDGDDGGDDGGDGDDGGNDDDNGGGNNDDDDDDDGGGNNDDDTNNGPATPYVNEPDSVSTIGGDTTDPRVITVTGGGEPGHRVDVTVGGETVSTVIGDDGTFTATFTGDTFPPDGNHEAVVTFSDNTGGTQTLDGPGFDIDTTPPIVNVTTGTMSVGDSFNADGMAGGVRLTGTGEAGATVEATIQGITRTTTIASDGTWSLTWQTGTLTNGEYNSPISFVVRDPIGNSATFTDTLVVDTVANVTINTNTVETDGVISATERADGVTITGTAQAGSTVVVNFGTGSQTVTSDTNGNWSATFPAANVPTGEQNAAVTAVATDPAGNTASTSGMVRVDTLVNNLSVAANTIEGDNVVSGAERADGVLVTGTVEPGSTVQVMLGNASATATVDANGNWQVNFLPSQVPEGEYTSNLRVFATDAVGNTAEVSGSARIDTRVNRLGFNADSTPTTVEGDGTINAIEAQDGVVLNGVVEPGSTVVVNFAGIDIPATVDGFGNWTVTIPPTALAPGTYAAPVVVKATDAVGNTDSIQQTLQVDTDAPDGPVVAAFTRDTSGIRSLSTDGNDTTVDVAAVASNGAITNVTGTSTYIQGLDETLHTFNSNVPDGSDLILSDTDTAGNRTSTYIALDDENPGATVSMSNPALGNYQIDAVDLQFAESSTLQLTDADIVALSDTTNTLTVHGGVDDRVQISGAVYTGGTVVDGQAYSVYDTGQGTLIVDADITVEDLPIIN